MENKLVIYPKTKTKGVFGMKNNIFHGKMFGFLLIFFYYVHK